MTCWCSILQLNLKDCFNKPLKCRIECLKEIYNILNLIIPIHMGVFENIANLFLGLSNRNIILDHVYHQGSRIPLSRCPGKVKSTSGIVQIKSVLTRRESQHTSIFVLE